MGRRGKIENEKSRVVGELQNAILNFIATLLGDSEINQIQLRDSDYRVRNLIYLRVIVPPFVLRYRIPLDAVNGNRRYFGGTGMNLADPSWPWGNLSNCMLVIVITARPAIITAKSQSALPFSGP